MFGMIDDAEEKLPHISITLMRAAGNNRKLCFEFNRFKQGAMRRACMCSTAELIKFEVNMKQFTQKHLRWIIFGPFSSYSCLVIHIVWKVERDARMDPPSQTEYLRSGGASTLILLFVGAKACISCHILSAIPSKRVDPPLRIILENKSFLTS